MQRLLQKIISMDEQPTHKGISRGGDIWISVNLSQSERRNGEQRENRVKGGIESREDIYIYKGSFNKGEVEEEIGARRKGRIGR